MVEKRVLQKKGWTEEEISKAESILDISKHHDIHFSKIVFWSALAVIVIGNILVSLVLLPFLIVFKSWLLYGFFSVIALVMGSLYNFLITDIGHLEKKNHIIATIIIPIIAIVNLVVIVLISNNFISRLPVDNVPHNQWVLSILFAVAFVLPFLFHKLWKGIKEKKVN